MKNMFKGIIYKLYTLFLRQLPTLWYCAISGLSFDKTWNLKGAPRVISRKWFERIVAGHSGGRISIGHYFSCNNNVTSNTIGLIQPCVFNIAIDGSYIEIGNNVGISGSTINAANRIVIEDNVAIGSGCIITDTDSHPILYEDRKNNNNARTKTLPIIIKEGAFIGARCLILKGVTIGKHAVIGAGSVVTKDIPDNCIACGNPAKVIKILQ